MRIVELRLAAEPAAWAAAGFSLADGATRVGSTRIRFVEPDGGRGLVGWSLSGASGTEFDGLETELVEGALGGAAPGHPISAIGIDHLVVFTPELERTISAFEANGPRCRRVREVGAGEERLRQAFFRLGEVIVEVVEVPGEHAGRNGAARFWGLTFTLADLDGAVAELGDRIGGIHDAVQPGRRIATVRKESGVGLPLALMTPHVRTGS